MSIKRLRRHPESPYVSCSPSKIPYVGFSPIRLQTGIQPRSSQANARLKLDDSVPHTLTYLYVVKALSLLSSVALYEQLENGMHSKSYPVQRPLARLKVMLSLWVIAYYGLIRDSRPSCCLICFVQQVFALRHRMGWYRELPHFAPHICSIVPSSVPRRSIRLLLTVPTPYALAFTFFAQVQQTQTMHAGSHMARVTRLRSSLYATARWIACPSPAQAFTFELSPLESPHSNVEYNYTGKQSIPVTGLSPVRYAALWAANEKREKK